MSSSAYSTCATYDATFSALPISSANALNQTTMTGYNATTDATGGFGLWPTSMTDPNSQASKTTYDPLGRTLSTTLPSEEHWADHDEHQLHRLVFWTAAQSPCVEVDSTSG